MRSIYLPGKRCLSSKYFREGFCRGLIDEDYTIIIMIIHYTVLAVTVHERLRNSYILKKHKG
jgi:hypothetical protein